MKRIVVSGAAGQIAYSLIFRLLSGELLGKNEGFHLTLLDIPQMEGVLGGVRMEIEDCAFPLLGELKIAISAEDAFKDGFDYVFLIGGMPRKKGMERKDLLGINGSIFAEQGRFLGEYGSKDSLVLVVANPCNTNCLIASHFAEKGGVMTKNQFFAMSALDEHRAKTQIALHAKRPVTSVRNALVWGNHSATMAADFVHAQIDGKPLLSVLTGPQHRLWLEETFFPTIQQRGAKVIEARGLSSAASAAHAALSTMRRIIYSSKTEIDSDYFSCSVYSKGNSYGLDENLYFSLPCRSNGNGDVTVVPGLDISSDPFLQKTIKITEKELQEERASIMNLLV